MKKLFATVALTAVGLVAAAGNQTVHAQSYTISSNTDYASVQNASGYSQVVNFDSTYLQDTSIVTGAVIGYVSAAGTAVNYPSMTTVSEVPTGTLSILDTVADGFSTNPVAISTATPTEDSSLSIASPTDPAIVSSLPSISASLSVDDTGIAYVEYGGSVALKWESFGTSSCSLGPIGQSGTQGQYLLQDITSNMSITLNCEAGPGYANYQIFPSWLGRVEVKVLPPSFGYLTDFLTQMQSGGSKKANLTSTSVFIGHAQKAYGSGKADVAKSFLQKSVDDFAKQAGRGGYPEAAINQYNEAVGYLVKTLPVKVAVAPDGCSVTVSGAAGLILEHGANYQMRKGYGHQTAIPGNGTVTEAIQALGGWTATGEVVDSNGLIYGRDTQDVAIGCPAL